MGLICVSCKKDVTNDKHAVVFKCPKCGEGLIVRCGNCKKTGEKYICPVCGFEGP